MGKNEAPERIPSLREQLEEILVSVWQAEAEWRFDDRLALFSRVGRDGASGGSEARSPGGSGRG